jgi:hypothetical protein
MVGHCSQPGFDGNYRPLALSFQPDPGQMPDVLVPAGLDNAIREPLGTGETLCS